MSDQINLVMVEFKNHLMKALDATSKLLPRMEEDDRLKPILLNVEKQYIGRNYNEIGEATGSITAKEVDSVCLFLYNKISVSANAFVFSLFIIMLPCVCVIYTIL